MLNLILDHKTYALPLNIGAVTSVCTLDENWRSLDYKSGDGFLALSTALTYVMPLEATETMFHQGLVSIGSDELENNERNLIVVHFDMVHSDLDPISGKIIMPQEFPCFHQSSFL
ncbi:hypothetical protein ACFQZJ_04120 [Maribacter chungangensis]|uniref:Uncharacterized protein n=1 Tax=Maribacter chungangensis TaxID=1069117 RepID=A0ABW3B1H4_9FLAO